MTKLLLFMCLFALGQKACSDVRQTKPYHNTDSVTDLTDSSIPKDAIPNTAASIRQQVNVNGIVRHYQIFIPPSINLHQNPNKNKSLPIIFSFHGLGSSASEQEEFSKMSQLAALYGFIVVYPEGMLNRQGKQYWNTKQSQNIIADINFVKAILIKLSNQYPSYPSHSHKVFATGMSNGGGMAHVLATNMADKLVAIAPVAGAYYDFDASNPNKPVAVLAFHGTNDKIIPYRGRSKRNLPDIQEWANFWATQNNCQQPPKNSVLSPEVVKEVWQDCQAETQLYTIRGRGHSWPGSNMPALVTTQQIDATSEILQFFAKQLGGVEDSYQSK